MYQDFNEFKQNFKNELAVELASANNPEISDARLFHVKLYTAMKNAKNNLGAEYNTSKYDNFRKAISNHAKEFASEYVKAFNSIDINLSLNEMGQKLAGKMMDNMINNLETNIEKKYFQQMYVRDDRIPVENNTIHIGAVDIHIDAPVYERNVAADNLDIRSCKVLTSLRESMHTTAKQVIRENGEVRDEIRKDYEKMMKTHNALCTQIITEMKDNLKDFDVTVEIRPYSKDKGLKLEEEQEQTRNNQKIEIAVEAWPNVTGITLKSGKQNFEFMVQGEQNTEGIEKKVDLTNIQERVNTRTESMETLKKMSGQETVNGGMLVQMGNMVTQMELERKAIMEDFKVQLQKLYGNAVALSSSDDLQKDAQKILNDRFPKIENSQGITDNTKTR